LNLAAAQIRWLFFDLGNTLINEEAPTERRMEQLAGAARSRTSGARCSRHRRCLRRA